MGKRIDPVERFWARVDRSPDGCWLWKGSHFNTGYAVLHINRKPTGAHRFAYELLVGPIPEGLHLDHLCRVRGCVNPEHLEPVTPKTNLLRGETKAAENAAKTHCPHGHPYDEANTYKTTGHRVCRTCNLANSAAYYRKRWGLVDSTKFRCGHDKSEANTYKRNTGGTRCRTCTLETNRRSSRTSS